MSRRGENIYKRKDGRCEGRYVIGRKPGGGTRFGYIYGRRYGEVRQRLAVLRAEQAERMRQTDETAKAMTLGEWMIIWMEEAALRLKPSSLQTYDNLVNRHIVTHLGHRTLDGLGPADIRDFADRMMGEGLSAATIKSALRLLSSALRAAQDEGMTVRNPCRKVRVPSCEAQSQRVLDRAEQDKLRQNANRSDLPALLSLYTGMRLGEICALRWSDVDWASRTVRVRRTVQRLKRGGHTELMLSTPKSLNSCRVIPLPAFLLEMLRAHQAESASEYLFGKAEHPAEPRTVQRRFHASARKLKIPGVHFHTLRHTFATRLLELGVDIKTISVLLGHSSARITLDVYSHSLLSRQKEAIQMLEGI